MIDNDDVDDAFMLSLVSSGWTAVVLFVLALIFWAIASSNDNECGKMHCDHGQPTLMHNHCMCVEDAK